MGRGGAGNEHHSIGAGPRIGNKFSQGNRIGWEMGWGKYFFMRDTYEM